MWHGAERISHFAKVRHARHHHIDTTTSFNAEIVSRVMDMIFDLPKLLSAVRPEQRRGTPLGVSPTWRNYVTQPSNIYIYIHTITCFSAEIARLGIKPNFELLELWPREQRRGTALSALATSRNYTMHTTNICTRAGVSNQKSLRAVRSGF